MENHRTGVIDFDPLGKRANLPRNRFDLSHEPDRQICHMNAEVQHRTAARFRSRREPLLPGRPELRSAMRKPRANEIRPADCTARERVLDGAFDSAEPPL